MSILFMDEMMNDGFNMQRQIARFQQVSIYVLFQSVLTSIHKSKEQEYATSPTAVLVMHRLGDQTVKGIYLF